MEKQEELDELVEVQEMPGGELFLPQCFVPPWEYGSDADAVSQSSYEVFREALGKFSDCTVSFEADEWIRAAEAIGEDLLCCLRKLCDDTSDEGDRDSVAKQLALWITCGLRRKAADKQRNEANEAAVQLACRLATSAFLLPDIRFAQLLAEDGVVELLIDVVVTDFLPVYLRTNAAEALLASTFHSAVALGVFFTQPDSVLDELAYLRIMQIASEKSIPLSVKQLIAYVIDQLFFVAALRELRRVSAGIAKGEKQDVEDIRKRVLTVRHLLMERSCHSDSSFYYASLHEGDILRSLCTLISSKEVDMSLREVCLELLGEIVHVDMENISAALFVVFSDSDVASLALDILSEAETVGRKCNLLAYAIKGLKLVDALAVANRSGSFDIDQSERLKILEELFKICIHGEEESKALVAAICHSDNVKYLLEVFSAGSRATPDASASEDTNSRIRHSKSYFYLTEILLTMARLQSDGSFWRRNAHFMCNLIENNLISSIASLKYWIEPLVADGALSGNEQDDVRHFLLSLSSRRSRRSGGNDFLGGITALRILDSLLKGGFAHSVTLQSSYLRQFRDRHEPPFDAFAEFCSMSGLQIVTEFVELAIEDCLSTTSQKGVLLPSDAVIYSTLFSSAISIIKRVAQAHSLVRKPFEQTAVGALVRVYGLFCCGRAAENPSLCGAVVEVLSLMCCCGKQAPASSQKLKGFLEALVEEGQQFPFTFLPVSELLQELFPYPLGSEHPHQLNGNFDASALAAQEIYVEAMISLAPSFRFVILMGTASTSGLRESVVSLCRRLAYLDAKAAAFVADALVDLSMQSLRETADCVLRDAIARNIDEDEEPCEIRLPAAADVFKLMIVALLKHCSRDRVLRAALITSFYRHSAHFRNVLSYFNVASAKTAVHVMFQAELIELFKNFCTVENSSPPEGPLLIREDFEKFIYSLVTHVGDSEQSLKNAILSLKALSEIGVSSLHGFIALRFAFSKQPGALLRFTRRLETAELSAVTFGTAMMSLGEILLSVLLKEPPLREVLEFVPSNESDASGAALLNDSLLALVNSLRCFSEDRSCTDAAAFFGSLLPIAVAPSDSVVADENTVDVAVWRDLSSVSRAVDEALLHTQAFSAAEIIDDEPAKRLAGDPQMVASPSLFDNSLPLAETDAKQLAEEFFQRSGNPQPALADSFRILMKGH